MSIIEIKTLTKTFGKIKGVRGNETYMRLRYYKRSAVISVSRIIPPVQPAGTMNQKQSAMKIAGRIIAHQRGVTV